MYKKYNEDGLEIIGFPCNQFLSQNKENGKDTVSFCLLNYGVTFENYEKIDVNGKEESPLYTYLKSKQPKDMQLKKTSKLWSIITRIQQLFIGSDIRWNFTKFVVDREGNVVSRYSPTVTAYDMEDEIVKLLEK